MSSPLGCQLCLAGRKAQLHLSFECNLSCFFCPVPSEKFGRDVVEYASETYTPADLQAVLRAIVENPAVEGVAISGGEPLLHVDRLLETVEYLKFHRGKYFHVHLYTNGQALTPDLVMDLASIGIDELRVNSFSPRVYERLSDAAFDVVAEIPCLPTDQYVAQVKRLIRLLNSLGLHRLNLNELEIAKENVASISRRGIAMLDNRAVESAAAAEEIQRYAEHLVADFDVFFCSYEMAQRIRIARNRVQFGEAQ